MSWNPESVHDNDRAEETGRDYPQGRWVAGTYRTHDELPDPQDLP